MGATSRERYAVVSCHVERPLDDAVWARFSALQEARPGGFAIAALMRPADPAFGEDEATWLERAREAAARGPLGHHTHWTAPDHARPTGGGDRGARRAEEGERLRELGLAPTLFCGGGWYTDRRGRRGVRRARLRRLHAAGVADRRTWPRASAGRRSRRPRASSSRRAGTLRAIPTTHSLGDLARALRAARRSRRSSTSTSTTRTSSTAHGERSSASCCRVLARRAHVPDLDVARCPSCCRTHRASRGTTWRGSKLPRDVRQGRSAGGDVASDADASPTASGRDVRASRLYLLSRGPILSVVRRVGVGRRARRPRRRRSRARDLPRARASARWSPATETSSGACSGAKARRSGSSSPRRSRPRLRAVRPLPAARAAARRGADPRVPHRRRAHRARVRDRDGLRLHDVGPHPDVGRRLAP